MRTFSIYTTQSFLYLGRGTVTAPVIVPPSAWLTPFVVAKVRETNITVIKAVETIFRIFSMDSQSSVLLMLRFYGYL